MPDARVRSRLFKQAAPIVLLLALNALWLKALTLGFFIIDDPFYVTGNPVIRGGFSVHAVAWAFSTTYLGFWIPLSWLSLALDVSWFGGAAWGYHLTNVLLHAANALLVYALFQRMTKARWLSFLAAALFSLHPLRVEAVVWITERKEVLAAFLSLLTLHLYVSYVRRKGPLRMLGLCLLYTASLLAKPVLVTLPLLLLVLDYWPLRRISELRWRGQGGLWGLVREKVPLFAIGGVMALNTLMIQGTEGVLRGSVAARVPNALRSYLLYLRDFVYTGRLSVLDPPHDVIAYWELGLAAIVLAAVSAAAVVMARRHPRYGAPFLAGWLFFLISIFPMSGILQSGFSIRADRFMYMPCLGLGMMVVFGWPLVKLPKPVSIGAGVALIAVLLVATNARLTLWQHPLALADHDLRIEPVNPYLEHTAGIAALQANRPEEARAHFQRAHDLDAEDFFPPGPRGASRHPATMRETPVISAFRRDPRRAPRRP